MVWIQYGTYRGCILYYSDTEPRLYWSPCVAGASTSKTALITDIDLTLGPVEPPPPEPPEDYIEETYRGVDIWWKVALEMFWAQVAVGYVAVSETLEEIYLRIDEILEFLEPPEEPPDGLFAQVVAAVQVWVNEIIGDRLQPVYNWIDNVLAGARSAWEGLVADAVSLISDVSGALFNLTVEVGDRWDAFNTLTLPGIFDFITSKADEISGTIDLAKTEIDESVITKFVDFAEWVRGLLAELDPHNILPDPQGYIATAFDTLIEPWVTKIVESFWTGLEEGLEE